MKDKELFLIPLVLFILLGLAYSPIKNASSTKNNSQDNSSIGTANNLGSTPNSNAADSIKSTAENVKDLEKSVDQKIAESKRSPYYSKVRMSGISGLYDPDPNKQFLTLSTILNKNETLKITGWYLKSDVTGYYATIGKAALLPFPYAQTTSDVVLQYKDRAVLTKGFSPIGISFRTNECTGYFQEDRSFYPSIPEECPEPQDEKLPVFSNVYDDNDECIRTLERVPRCSTVSNQFVRDLPDNVTLSCKNYMTTQINYNTCVALHFSDTDFPGTEYRLYFNKFGPLWRQTHDTINLLDENGLIVDSISY